MLCDFARPDKVRLTIQDMDRVSESTESTSILTWLGKAGRFKTRDVAETLQLRGFGTTIIERLFDGRFSYVGSIMHLHALGLKHRVFRSSWKAGSVIRRPTTARCVYTRFRHPERTLPRCGAIVKIRGQCRLRIQLTVACPRMVELRVDWRS
jgi:hypothetical protein